MNRTDGRSAITALLLSSRPVSWINTAFPFAAAYILTMREIDLVLIVGTIFFLVPYNLAMYGLNDVFDYASDLANPRKGGIEGALLPPRLHRATVIAAAVSTVPFVAILAVWGGPVTWAALAVSLFAVVAYSVPPFRFKERPVLDSVTSSIHFVSPAVVGLALAGAELGAAVDASVLLALGAFLAWGMASHAFGAVQDVIPDREAGIGSIATAFGAASTVRVAVGLWAVAAALMLCAPFPADLTAIVAVPYIVNAAPWWNVTDAASGETNRAWRRFLWLNYASGFAVTLVLIAVWFA